MGQRPELGRWEVTQSWGFSTNLCDLTLYVPLVLDSSLDDDQLTRDLMGCYDEALCA